MSKAHFATIDPEKSDLVLIAEGPHAFVYAASNEVYRDCCAAEFIVKGHDVVRIGWSCLIVLKGAQAE